MHRYLSLDIICSSKLTVFLELRSRKTVRFSKQIMSADKYPCIFSRQMEAIVYINWINCISAMFQREVARKASKSTGNHPPSPCGTLASPGGLVECLGSPITATLSRAGLQAAEFSCQKMTKWNIMAIIPGHSCEESLCWKWPKPDFGHPSSKPAIQCLAGLPGAVRSLAQLPGTGYLNVTLTWVSVWYTFTRNQLTRNHSGKQPARFTRQTRPQQQSSRFKPTLMGRRKGDGYFEQERIRMAIPLEICNHRYIDESKDFSKSILNDDVLTNSDNEVDDM